MEWFNPPFFIGFHGEVPHLGRALSLARPVRKLSSTLFGVTSSAVVHPVLDSGLNVVSITKVTKVSNIGVSNMLTMTLLKLNHPIN